MTFVFTEDDLVRYFDLVQLPAEYRDYRRIAKDYSFLKVLHIYQITAIPYENLSIHYSKSQAVHIDPRLAFEKFLSGRGRGGYCMEAEIFFLHILRAIGFEVYFTGVRIRLRADGVPQGNFGGLVHIVSLVTLENGDKYSVDVAFGGDGPTHPMKLEPGLVTTNLGAQQVRLLQEAIPQFATDDKFWIYQYRNGVQEWNTFYCFQETPFLYEDFQIMNYNTSTAPTSFQTVRVLVVRFLREQDRITGKVMLVDGVVKRNVGGRTEVVKECQTEEERITALQEYFDITLTDEERGSIQGRVTELPMAQ